MKRLLFFLLILAFAILIGVQIKTNPGYLLISTNTIAIETRLWFAILCLLILFLIFYFIVRIFKYTGSISSRWHHFRRKGKKVKAAKQTYQGLMDLAEGNWQSAQKHLMKEVKNAPAPLVNYLAAAIAAQRDAQEIQRDQYLRKAYEAIPQAKIAIGLVQAQLQYDASQYELALATLKHLYDLEPKQKQVLRLLAKVYKKLGEWMPLVDLLPQLQKQDVFSHQKLFNEMVYAAYCHVFSEIGDVQKLQKIWKSVPRHILEKNSITVFYVKALLRLKQDEQANDFIIHRLKRRWNSDLITLYAQLDFPDLKKPLKQVEHWLKQHTQDPDLLFTAACLAERDQLWGKAKDYYQRSISIKETVHICVAYAKLLEQLGEIDQSLIYYRKGCHH